MARVSHQYRLHRASGRAFVVLAGKRVYLGKFGSEESRDKYRLALAEFKSTGRAPSPSSHEDSPALSVNEMILPYVEHIDGYYLRPDGRPTGEARNIKIALRIVKEKFGQMEAHRFSAEHLEECRDEMVRRGWCRKSCNVNTHRIRRAFKWAARKRFIPASVIGELSILEALKPFRTPARETEPIRPVPIEHVEKCLPFLTSPVAAMVRLQLLTGMRPGEAVQMKASHIDMSADVWVYSPSQHKTSWRGSKRSIYLGPQSQEVLRPFLNRSAEAYLFSPREGRKEFVMKAYGKCKEKRSRRKGRKVPNEFYRLCSYRSTIKLACERAGVSHWSPNQLRHTRGTEVRRQFGLEAASVVLGHARCDVTQVYAEANTERALEIVRQTG
jgi:integrase